MPFCLPSRSLSVANPLPLVVVVDSNRLFVRVSRRFYPRFLYRIAQTPLRSKAEVTIVLKNQGEEAYKPKEYGKSIVIRRAFTRDGSSSWKIMSKDGTVISNKRDELAAICDHMNIQVDNPMNVLTQGKISVIRGVAAYSSVFLDAARQFLNASHPSDKYKVRVVSRCTDDIIYNTAH